MNSWIEIAIACVAALAAVVGVVVAWMQYRSSRRERENSKCPIIRIEPREREMGESSRFTVENIGEEPAFDVFAAIIVTDVETLATIKDLHRSEIDYRWTQVVGALAKGERKQFQIDATPEDPGDWPEVANSSPIGFGWSVHCKDLSGREYAYQGLTWTPSTYVLRFPQE